MSYYKTEAEKIPDSFAYHRWADYLIASMKETERPLLDELTANGDLADYVKVTVWDAVKEYESLLREGIEENIAKEVVLDDLLGQDFRDSEDWIEQDAAAGLAMATLAGIGTQQS